jgi:hypothetical protein
MYLHGFGKVTYELDKMTTNGKHIFFCAAGDMTSPQDSGDTGQNPDPTIKMVCLQCTGRHWPGSPSFGDNMKRVAVSVGKRYHAYDERHYILSPYVVNYHN